MKGLISVLTTVLQDRTARSKLRALRRLLVVLAILIVVFSVSFHYLMA